MTSPASAASQPAVALPTGLLPAQRLVCTDLLDWGGDRPIFDDGLVEHLTSMLDERLADVVSPGDEPIYLSKSRLRALDCEGRWLDMVASDFAWTTPMIVGQLVHRCIELDTAAGRKIHPDAVVDRAVHEVASLSNGRAAHLNGLDNLELLDIQATCRDRIFEWRDLWPLLQEVHVRFEHRLALNLQRGRVVISGQPDLVVTSPIARPRVATAVIVDLKTGRRNEGAERGDLRLYALLWTLKYRQPPFRWATYYLAEGRWDIEDFDAGLLEATVRRLEAAVRRVVRLTGQPPPDDELVLHPGAHCFYCGRRETCPKGPSTWSRGQRP